MDKMTISQLYDQLLSDKEWQNPETGKLFFPAYIFSYDPTQEYVIRKEIEDLKSRLKRPNNFIDTLVLNIFEEFMDFLRTSSLGTESLLDLLLEKDQSEDPSEELIDILTEQANSLEFFNFVNAKAEAHFELPSKFKKVYLLLHGFGSIFPFLRASTYLKNFEEHVDGYKLIVFFPGSYESKQYHLFNHFHDENIYRATLINPQES
jgi:hypothetical protein